MSTGHGRPVTMRVLNRVVNPSLNFGYNAGMRREATIQWAIVAAVCAMLSVAVNKAYQAVPTLAAFCVLIVASVLAEKYLKDFTKP